MITLKKSLTAVLLGISVTASLCISVNAAEIPQSLKEENSYVTADGFVEHEYIWEDKINDGIMPLESLETAKWVDISDSTSMGQHRSAKETDLDDRDRKWYAVAETKLYNSFNNEEKYHYTRTRILHGSMIYSDSDRCWAMGHSYAKTPDSAKQDLNFFLRSYWGYEE